MKSWKRVLALGGVFIILLTYVVMLIMAVFVKKFSWNMFMMSLVVTVMVPVLLYIVFWLYDVFHRNDRTEQWEAAQKKAFEEANELNSPK